MTIFTIDYKSLGIDPFSMKQIRRALLLCVLSWMAMCTADTASAASLVAAAGQGIIFGNIQFDCCDQPGYTYRLNIREADTGKSTVVLLDRSGPSEQYAFAKALPAGRYYFSDFVATNLAWENHVFDKTKYFEVRENTVVYLGDWHFKLSRAKTRYSVKYPAESASTFALENEQLDRSTFVVGVIGGNAVPLTKLSK